MVAGAEQRMPAHTISRECVNERVAGTAALAAHGLAARGDGRDQGKGARMGLSLNQPCIKAMFG